jgi:hypothetical protein
MSFNAPSTLITETKRSHFVALVVFIGIASGSAATDYSSGARLNVDASHNDNLRMSETDKISVNKYLVTPVFTLSADTERSKLQLASTLYFNRYDKNEFDSNDQNIGLAFTHEFENSSVGLNANVVRDSTITSEQLTSGVVGRKAERTERYQAAPSWSYTLNETNVLQLNGSYTIQDYRTSSYTGYKNIGTGLDWIHIINERFKLVVSATYSDYHSDDSEKLDVPNQNISIPVQTGIDSEGEPIIIEQGLPAGIFGQQTYSTRTKESGGQVGLDYYWSEASLLQARVGRSRSKTTYPITDSSDVCSNAFRLTLLQSSSLYAPFVSGFCDLESNSDLLSTAQLNWNWSNEHQQFSLSTTKSSQPSSNGYVIDALQVSSSWSYRLTEKDQISANLSLVRNRAINKKSSLQNTSIANRDYESAALSYRRQVNEQWSVSASYQFGQQKYNDIDTQANSKIISLGIRYQPQEWHWAR